MQEIHINGRDIMLSVYVLTAGRLANNHAYLFDITVCQLVVLCICILFLYFKNLFSFLFRASANAYKPFCPAHTVLCNINICYLYYIFEQ